MPVLGICLGAQLLARALGAEVRPGEGLEIGFTLVEVSAPGPSSAALLPAPMSCTGTAMSSTFRRE